MKKALTYELEVADDCATLYLMGVLEDAHAFTLNRICRELPKAVTTLRLDLHGVSSIREETMQIIRSVLRFWRESRGGSFRLSIASEHIVATYAEGTFANAAMSLRKAPAHVVELSPATTAMYL